MGLTTSDSIPPSVKENITPRKPTYGGGITCCVPDCSNNSVRNNELSFYVVPKYLDLREKWLDMLGRRNFVPSTSRRVCSAHFVGGKKTYMNNIPTINMPLSVTPRKTKNSTVGRMKSALVPRKLNFDQDIQYTKTKRPRCPMSSKGCDRRTKT